MLLAVIKPGPELEFVPEYILINGAEVLLHHKSLTHPHYRFELVDCKEVKSNSINCKSFWGK